LQVNKAYEKDKCAIADFVKKIESLCRAYDEEVTQYKERLSEPINQSAQDIRAFVTVLFDCGQDACTLVKNERYSSVAATARAAIESYATAVELIEARKNGSYNECFNRVIFADVTQLWKLYEALYATDPNHLELPHFLDDIRRGIEQIDPSFRLAYENVESQVKAFKRGFKHLETKTTERVLAALEKNPERNLKDYARLIYPLFCLATHNNFSSVQERTQYTSIVERKLGYGTAYVHQVEYRANNYTRNVLNSLMLFHDCMKDCLNKWEADVLRSL